MRRHLILVLVVVTACSPDPEPIASTAAPPTTASTSPAATTTSTTGGPTTTTSPPTTTTLPPLQSLAYEEMARLEFPVQLTPRNPATSYLATKDGRVWTFDGVSVASDPVLDINEQVRNQGEQGLLSIVFHPEQDNRLFIHYSANDGDTVVAEYSVTEAGAVGPDPTRELLRLDQPARNHNGGMLQFASDGYLYLGLGDGGGSNDRFGNGQNTDTLLGGLVRFDVDDPEAAPELYQYGLRNPWRFWIEGSVIYVADVGQNAFEEVSVASLEPGVNYGWPITEGLHCFRPSSGCDTSGLTPPVIEVGHGDAGTCSITGGVVYRGTAIPEIDGHFFYSDYCGGYLRSFRYEDGVVVEEADWTDQMGVAGRVTGFGIDGQGEMYLTTTDRLLKVVANRG